MVEIKVTNGEQVSDGYHTFDELYEHRYHLFIALCQEVKPRISVFKTMKHADGTMYAGWFLLMMVLNKGRQISYHLPMRLWDQCDFSEREYAPEFDGHTSDDVLERLRML